jgi:hypothetical protein
MEDVLNGTASSIQIFWTKDYGKFRFLKGNRDLDEAKIRRIMRSIENGLEFFRYCPIMVNEEGFVIDGQHRFYVCKKLGLNVYYVVVPNFMLRQVAEMNNNASKWKDRDYLNCYVDVGIPDYQKLHEFIKTHDLNIGIAISLLSTGKVRASGGLRDNFREGLFTVSYQDAASEIINLARRFDPFCETYKSRSFLEALEVLMQPVIENNVGLIEELIEKLKKHELTIEKRSTPKEYLAHLEDLFNFRNSKRRRIY